MGINLRRTGSECESTKTVRQLAVAHGHLRHPLGKGHHGNRFVAGSARESISGSVRLRLSHAIDPTIARVHPHRPITLLDESHDLAYNAAASGSNKAEASFA